MARMLGQSTMTVLSRGTMIRLSLRYIGVVVALTDTCRVVVILTLTDTFRVVVILLLMARCLCVTPRLPRRETQVSDG